MWLFEVKSLGRSPSFHRHLYKVRIFYTPSSPRRHHHCRHPPFSAVAFGTQTVNYQVYGIGLVLLLDDSVQPGRNSLPFPLWILQILEGVNSIILRHAIPIQTRILTNHQVDIPMGNPPDTSFPSDSVNFRRHMADSSFSFIVLQRILIPIVVPHGPSERLPSCRRGPRRHSAGPRFFSNAPFSS